MSNNPAAEDDRFVAELKDISRQYVDGSISATVYEERWNAIEAERAASLGFHTS